MCVVETRQRHGGVAGERKGRVLKVRVRGTEEEEVKEEEDRIRGREGERGSSISISGKQWS